jgi:hypothetical protein
MRSKANIAAVNGNNVTEECRVRRLELYLEIDAAIRSIHACVAALQRLNAKQKSVKGSKWIPWELEYESLLERIALELAYPKRRHSSTDSMPYS